MHTNLDDIRPYNDEEVIAATQRIAASDLFRQIITSFYPEEKFEDFKAQFLNIKSVHEFHIHYGVKVAEKVIQASTSSCTVKSVGPIEKGKAYSFISNHRDIVMDALVLQVYMINTFDEVIEISFGSNLMVNPLIVDIGKCCQMYKTDRSGTARELYHKLNRLSEYLKYAITVKGKSTWIAQRNGRTKDGLDKTDPGLVKMYSLSGKDQFKEHFIKMNLTPVSISYQYESCDYLKVREIYLKQLGGVYKKHKNEDYESIVYGINQPKGECTLIISNPITATEINELSDNYSIFCHELTKIIDQRIIESYQFWNTNYIAFDLLHHSDHYSTKYTTIEKEDFIRYMNNQLSNISDIKETQVLEKLFLQLYAHPIQNKIEWHDYC